MELGLATAVTQTAAQCKQLRDGKKGLSYILSRGEHEIILPNSRKGGILSDQNSGAK